MNKLCDGRRQNATNCLTNLPSFVAGDKKNGNLPDNFPGVLRVDLKSENLLHSDYRSADDNIPEEFIHFCERLLPHVCTGRRAETTEKTRANTLLSETHSTSDEACGLLVVDNELDAWNKICDKKEKKLKGNDLRTKRKYCSSKDGKGFSAMGVQLCKCLEKKVGILRKQDKDKQLEKKLRDHFRQTMKSSENDRHEEDEEEAEDMSRLRRLLRSLEEQESKMQK